MKAIGITSAAILSLVLGIAASAYTQQEEHGDKKDRQENKQDQAKPEKQPAQEPGKSDHKQQQPAAQQQERPANGERQHQDAADQNKQDKQDKDKQQGQAEDRQKSNEKQPQPQRADQQQRQNQNKQEEHAQQQSAQSEPPHAQQQDHGQRPVTPEQQRVQQTAWQQHRSDHWDSDHHTWQQRGGYHGYRIPDDHFRGFFGPDHGFRINGLPFLVVGGFPRFQYEGYWFSLVDPWPQSWNNNWYDTDDVYVSYVDNGYYLFNRRHPDVGIAISISL
jgi:hypothetical protein